jgi:hypothetical protein
VNTISIPAYCQQATRTAAEALNGRIAESQARLATAKRLADAAREIDPMTGDVDSVLHAGSHFRRAKVDAMREEIQIRRDLDPLLQAIAADRQSAEHQAADDLHTATDAIRRQLQQMGFADAVATEDIMGNRPIDALIASNSRIVPLAERLGSLQAERIFHLNLPTENKRELATSMARLKAEFDQAAGASPAKPSFKRSTEDIDTTCHEGLLR